MNPEDAYALLEAMTEIHGCTDKLHKHKLTKVKSGETKKQALIRECKEELNVLVSVGDIFMDVIHEYPDLTLHLTLFNANIADGEPKKLEHNDIQWITPSEIPNYDFCPADKEILKRISDKFI